MKKNTFEVKYFFIDLKQLEIFSASSNQIGVEKMIQNGKEGRKPNQTFCLAKVQCDKMNRLFFNIWSKWPNSNPFP